MPVLRSSARIWCESAGWETSSRSAARVNDSASATAIRYRSCRRVTLRRRGPPRRGGSTPALSSRQPSSSGGLPVAGDETRLARDAALGEQVAADCADGARLAVDERVDVARGEVERAHARRRAIAVRRRAATSAAGRRATRAELVLRARRPRASRARGAGGDARERRGDRRDDARVADQQVPVGVGVGRVGAAGALSCSTSPGCAAAAHGPATPSSPWTTKSIVSRPCSASQPRDGVGAGARPLLARARPSISSTSNGAAYRRRAAGSGA